jgi:hypothetical protein
MPSKVPALIDYLVGLFTADPSLAALSLGGQSGVTVFDGPATVGADPFLKLFIGLADPDADTIQAAATWSQSRGDMGTTTRDETVTIYCCAEAWSGSDSVSDVRHAVFAVTGAVETLVRADTTRFGGNAAQATPGFASGSLMQNNTEQGAVARVQFSLTFRTFT